MSSTTVKWYYSYYPDSSKKGKSLLENFTTEQIANGFIVAEDIVNPKDPPKKSHPKRFALFPNWRQFRAYEKKVTKRHFYEVILDVPQKLKFDYDSDTPNVAEQDFPLVLEVIKDVFHAAYNIELTNDDLVICSSHSEPKRSWHVIIHGYYVSSTHQAKLFYDLVAKVAPPTKNSIPTKKGTLTRCLDETVYKSFQLFRMLGSCKAGTTRTKIFDLQQQNDFDFEQTLIQYIDGCTSLPDIADVAPKTKVAPKSPRSHSAKSVEEITAILERLSPARWQSRKLWIDIGMALKSELGEEGLVLWKQFSEKHYEQYSEDEHNDQWRSFKKEGITMGTIIMWANEDTPLERRIKNTKLDIAEWIQHWSVDSDNELEDKTAKDNIEIEALDEDLIPLDEVIVTLPPSSKSEVTSVLQRPKLIPLGNIQAAPVATPKPINPKPPIYKGGRYYSDISQIMGKPVSVEEATKFLDETCACIVNGGNAYYYTKDIEDGNLVYTRVKPKEFEQFKLTIKQPKPSKVEVDPDDKKTLAKMLKTNKQKVQQVTLASILRAHAHNIMYDRAVFRPYVRYEEFVKRSGGRRLFNIFTGFRAQLSAAPIDEGLIEPWLWHMENVLCAGNEEAFQYMLNWLAHLCQRPHKKTGVMIALRSLKQGAGKNIFWDFIGKNIIGSNMYVVLNDIDQLLSKFNSILQNKLLTICDEIGNYGGAFRSNDKLKSVISQIDQVREPKGVDSRQVEDYQNLVGLSNNVWPYKVEAGDRRFFVLEVSNEKVGDMAYFDRLARHATDECGTHFYNMLMRRDISTWKAERMPTTELKRSFKLWSCPAQVLFMMDCLSRRTNHAFTWKDVGPTIVYSEELFNGFKAWQLEENNTEKIDNKNALSESLKLIGIVSDKVKRPGSKQRRGFRFERRTLLNAIRVYLKDPEFDVEFEDDVEDSAEHASAIEDFIPEEDF